MNRRHLVWAGIILNLLATTATQGGVELKLEVLSFNDPNPANNVFLMSR